jgi:glycosyltransferase involved in cell wall biosynthesis
MKIAVFHNLMSGGAKRSVFEMVRRLVQGHELDVFTLSCAEAEFCDLRPIVRAHRVFSFRPLPLLRSPFGLFNPAVRAVDIVRLGRVQQEVAREIDRAGYDIVLVHNDRYTNSPQVLRYLRSPSVFYCHDPLRVVYDPPIPRPYLKLRGLRCWVDRLNFLRRFYFAVLARVDAASLRAATRVLVNSHFSRETIYRAYRTSAQVCYQGIDSETFWPKNHERDRYVLAVGSVNPIKGFDFIVHSLGLIPVEERPPLLVVGNFSVEAERDYLREEARDAGVEVEFRTLVSEAELVDLYRRARVTVCTPILEPFGFVPLESMACGTPVVGVAEGGLRETIRHGETGLLTDRDPRLFAAAVEELLADPGYAESLGMRGPEYVRTAWSWDACVRRLESILGETASGRATTAARHHE